MEKIVTSDVNVLTPLKTPGLRVLLINPRQTYPLRLASEYQSYFPTGLAYIGATLEHIGVETEIVDCLAYNEKSIENGKISFGLSEQSVGEIAANFRPHVVGISNPFSMFIENALRTAHILKTIDPSMSIVLGGIYASVYPMNYQLLEQFQDIDLLMVGEGEATWRDLLDHYSSSKRCFEQLSSVPGIIYRAFDGQVITNPKRPFLQNLDILPFPAYHLIDMELMFSNPHYAAKRLKARNGRCLPIITSRGCPYTCNFCSVHSQVGYQNRTHSVNYIVKHINYVRERYSINHFHFEDDNLTLNAPRARKLFLAIKELEITWDTPNGVRADTITKDLAKLMANSGASSVTIAVESGDEYILNHVIRKRLDLNRVLDAAQNLVAVDVPIIAFFIIGFPGETQTEIRHTLRFAKRLANDFKSMNLLFVATPLEGTLLYMQCMEKGFFVAEPNNETLLSAVRLNQMPLIATPDFNKNDLFEWTREELDSPQMCCVGSSIPMFWANTEQAWRQVQRILPCARELRPYDWSSMKTNNSQESVKQSKQKELAPQ